MLVATDAIDAVSLPLDDISAFLIRVAKSGSLERRVSLC